MVIMGFVIATRAVRYGLVPPFFQPQRFMIINPMTVLTFAGLTWTAIAMRRSTDWHRRLHVCAMATIMGPGFRPAAAHAVVDPVEFRDRLGAPA